MSLNSVPHASPREETVSLPSKENFEYSKFAQGYREAPRVALVEGRPGPGLAPGLLQHLEPRRLHVDDVRPQLWRPQHLESLIVRIQQTHVSGVDERTHALRVGAVQVPLVLAVLDELAGLDVLLHLLPGHEMVLLAVYLARSRWPGRI